MKLKRLINLVILSCLCSACGSDKQDSIDNKSVQTLQSEFDTSEMSSKSTAKRKPWSGSAQGYIHTATGENDRIELFIRFGRLLGATSLYAQRVRDYHSLRNTDAELLNTLLSDGRENVTAIFNPQLLASYAEFDPMVQAKAKELDIPLDIQSAITTLADQQHINDLLDRDRANRESQSAANRKTALVASRVRDAVLAFFPSRHEYLLASSALIREAGDKIATAVAADGVIVNTDLFGEAYSLIDWSYKLNPKNVTYCNAQRLSMRTHKKAVDNLMDKMVPNQLGQKLTITATDVYQLALNAHEAGKRFAVTDSVECS